jgi:glycosyltransferase involved in cell wall biosynthesis
VSFNDFQVIRNGFDVNYHQKFIWNDPHDGIFKLAFLGRLEYTHKGLDMLLEVLAMKKWKERPLKIMAYGHGPHEQTIKDTLATNDMKNFILCGFTNDLAKAILQAQGVIFSSKMEGTPISLVDSMLCYRMAIVTPVGGMPEIVIDGKNGFVAISATVAGIDECLERAWQKRHEWEQLGKNAGKMVREVVPEFPHKQCIEAINDILNNDYEKE